MPHPKDEIRAAYDRYVAQRSRAEAGRVGWDTLADFFTEDAYFVDPAWGRIEGREAIRRFMVALDDAPTGAPDGSDGRLARPPSTYA